MGILLSLLAAVFVSFRSAFEKKALKKMDEFTVALGFRFSALAFIILGMILFGAEFHLQKEIFFRFILLGGVLNAISSVLVMKAFKVGDLSTIGPIATFTPLFILITSPLIIGEVPSAQGMIGVILIVIGTYVLNIKEVVSGYGAPVFSLFNKNKGALYMLGAAFVWSIGANIDKIGVEASNPFIWAGSINALVVILLLPIVLARKRGLEKVNKPKNSFFLVVLAGLAGTLVAIFQLYAIGMILVVYVISLKRLSAIFEVFIGHFAFKEKNFKERLIGASIMVLGAVLIILS